MTASRALIIRLVPRDPLFKSTFTQLSYFTWPFLRLKRREDYSSNPRITLKRSSVAATQTSLLATKSYMDKVNGKIVNEASEAGSVNNELSLSIKKMHIDKNVANNVDVNFNDGSKEDVNNKNRKKYKEIRRWIKIKENVTKNTDEYFDLRLLSFNILAQDLLETHNYLYRNHSGKDLPWNKRKPLIIQEILESDAHIVCLQEMQEKHLAEFLASFQRNGYAHLYKKRTNDKKDGLLLLYKENLFDLLEFIKVELYQTNIELLSRDNVGLIGKFSLKNNPETKFVVATTHLLFNPRREDVRLGQLQLLFAEIERISFVEELPHGPQYLPVILSGDFNLEPDSGVYKFVTEGSIEFQGKGRNLEKSDRFYLNNSLIPPNLFITDECQHFNVLSKRLTGKGSGKVMLRNTENKDTVKADVDSDMKNLVNLNTFNHQKIEVQNGHFVTFSSGLLTHPFQFKSVYQHTNNGTREATTFQNHWVTVDYIFYRKMEPIEKYMLPTVQECNNFLRNIPNSVVGSDHLCIGATFQIKKS